MQEKLEMDEKFEKVKYEMESILHLVSENGCFNEIDIKLVDVKNVDANVLARCFNSLEKLKMLNSHSPMLTLCSLACYMKLI